MHRPALLCLSLLLSSGCLVFDGGEDPCTATDVLTGAEAELDQAELRDPQTGLCGYVGGGGGGGGTTCGDYGGANRGAPEFRDWAICYAQCEGFDEASCLESAGCRAAYIDQWGEQSFYECWGTAPSGPVQGGDCTLLAAQECSRHDDCSAVHASWEAPGEDGGFQNGLGEFQRCIPEASQPDPGQCTGDVICRAEPPDCPEGSAPGIADGCWTDFCIPLEECETPAECSSLGEQECIGRTDCEGIYQGVDCSCTGESCVCAEWVFESCEGDLTPLPASA